MWPLVYAESWRSLSIFLRVSEKQLLKYYSILVGLWSTSWDRSPTCSLLHHNRGIYCFLDTSYTCHWSTCYCWPVSKRDLFTENWIISWKQRMRV